MGYTQRYTIPTLDKKKFKTLSEELKIVYGMLPVYSKSCPEFPLTLCGGDGTGLPQFKSNIICFNGKSGEHVGDFDLSHETFVLKLKNQPSYDFCKTARKPYDLMVCISLLRLKHHFPETEIGTDGTRKDWKEAIDLYKKIFREKAPEVKF